MMATPSAMSPTTWAVSTGCPSPMAEDSATGWAFPLPLGASVPGEGLGVADGSIAGNRPDALPGPMSELETPFRSGMPLRLGVPLRLGMDPSGRVVVAEVLVGDWVDDWVDDLAGDLVGDLVGEADAAVTATVSVADGGVHFTEVTMAAVAISFTDVTEVALDATGICA